LVKKGDQGIFGGLHNLFIQLTEWLNNVYMNISSSKEESEYFPSTLHSIFRYSCLLLETLSVFGALQTEDIGRINSFLQFAEDAKIPEVVLNTLKILEQIRKVVDPENKLGSISLISQSICLKRSPDKQFSDYIFNIISVLSSSLVLLLQCSKPGSAPAELKIDQYITGINYENLVRKIHGNALLRSKTLSDCKNIKGEAEGDEPLKHELLYPLIARNALLQLTPVSTLPSFIWRCESYSGIEDKNKMTFCSTFYAFLGKKITTV
jgi:hypothetical protein